MTASGEIDRNRLIGQRLKVVRSQFDEDQATFSQKLGVPLTTYRNYEQGHREISVELLAALRRVYGIDPWWVWDGPGLEPKKSPTMSDVVELAGNVFAKVQKLMAKLDPDVPPEARQEIFEAVLADSLEKQRIDAGLIERFVRIASYKSERSV